VPDVSSNARGVVRMRAALDVHKRTIVCASQPDDPRAGELELQEIPNTSARCARWSGGWAAPTGWWSATRRGPAAMTCSGC
jgi:hypothetical protein